ncbi:universal stress protein [Halobacillus halophilus]|uniref:UspA domain protein n=1 Tax=Halobacillus halophilus (strain ATCC 35676 / DSM 2266 / JCM 20832 / KCTC 3685 / LMG 17431 / NBRC 102448 / NCIMB 2269) TaxID=866895 RepID=I0JK44_HALH3|nr:universal stress protein [Halobacillus halophilus]ASF38662.1 universal stress protein [Halobacillus halophilus]CCG44513.1 UspA domain protein [Halobacillus halophilus DSM 2266]
MYKKILLAADGSGHSVRTAERAAELARLQGDGEITIIYVVDGEQSKSDVLSEGDKGTIELRRHERLNPIEQMLESKGLSYQVALKHGEPGPEIVKFANDEAFDIVVIGSRGLNTLQEMVLGSVSHKVAKRAKCPVMIVK